MNDEVEKLIASLREFVGTVRSALISASGQWLVKGFITANKEIYTISCDTKVISKILEIQLFPKLKEFADKNGYELILAEKQNWYPDLSFISKADENIKFAVDIKTTYRCGDKPAYCNGFTLGSHGEYFRNRVSTKNIQFPYASYAAHICLGIIYTRALLTDLDDTRIFDMADLSKIISVIKDMEIFVQEKWKIASGRSGSGNTANIGSINYIPDIIAGKGEFSALGEGLFDEYWTNYNVMEVPDERKDGAFKKLTKLSEFLKFKCLKTK